MELLNTLKGKKVYIYGAGMAGKVCASWLEVFNGVKIVSFVVSKGHKEERKNIVEEGVLPRVDYIKADIEGAERDMLRGAIKTMQRFAPKLSICTYHYPEDKQLLTDIILSANPQYHIEYCWRKLYAWV